MVFIYSSVASVFLTVCVGNNIQNIYITCCNFRDILQQSIYKKIFSETIGMCTLCEKSKFIETPIVLTECYLRVN
jgi:hypothetical protein